MDLLPYELVFKIYSSLNLSDRLNLRITSRKFKLAGDLFVFKDPIFKYRLAIGDIKHLPIKILRNSNLNESTPTQVIDSYIKKNLFKW